MNITLFIDKMFIYIKKYSMPSLSHGQLIFVGSSVCALNTN